MSLFRWLFKDESVEEWRLLKAKEQLDKMKDEATRLMEIQHRVRQDLATCLQQLRQEEERSRLEVQRRREARLALAEDDYIDDPAWGRWKRNLGYAEYDRAAVEKSVHD